MLHFFCQGLYVELDSLLLTHTAYFRLKIIDGDFVISLIVKKQSHLRPNSIRIDKTRPFFSCGVHLSVSKIIADNR